MEGAKESASLAPLDWGGARVRLEFAFLGKVHRFEHEGPFIRIGSDPRCELCIPGLPTPVCVYLQVGRKYVAVLELVDSTPTAVCEPVYALPGATVWMQPNARLTVESLVTSGTKPESFSWENFNVEDVRVFPNTLVARSGFVSSGASSPHMRIASTLSVLGSSPSCPMRAEHKHISRFQAIVFRGEHQGEPCRVVDLFGEHPTLLDNQPANGQVLEVGSQLRVANLSFEAVRFLYNASRPNQLVEVRSQFTTLPLPSRDTSKVASASKETSSSNSQLQPGSILPDLRAMKDRLSRAIGYDSGPSRKPTVHFPVEPRNQESRPPAQSSEPASSQLVDGLDRLAKTQERIASEFEKLSVRLVSVEKSLDAIPEILESNALQLAQTVESLKDAIQQVSNRSIESKQHPLEASPQVPQANSAKPKQSQIPQVKPEQSKKNKPQQSPIRTSTRQSNRELQLGKPTGEKTAGEKTTGEKTQSLNQKVESVESVAPPKTDHWLSRLRESVFGSLATSASRRREVAEPANASDPLNLGSQSTAKRTRLQHHDDESELLAASQSEEEALVLGSLMGLRYRDAKKALLRWGLFTIALAATTLVGAPMIWNKIPEGWRELLWQKITFAKTPQEIEYEANLQRLENIPPEAPSTTEPVQPPQPEQPSEPEKPANSSDPERSSPPSD